MVKTKIIAHQELEAKHKALQECHQTLHNNFEEAAIKIVGHEKTIKELHEVNLKLDNDVNTTRVRNAELNYKITDLTNALKDKNPNIASFGDMSVKLLIPKQLPNLDPAQFNPMRAYINNPNQQKEEKRSFQGWLNFEKDQLKTKAEEIKARLDHLEIIPSELMESYRQSLEIISKNNKS